MSVERCSCDPSHGEVYDVGKPMCDLCCYAVHPYCPCSCFHCTPEQGVTAPCTCENSGACEWSATMDHEVLDIERQMP